MNHVFLLVTLILSAPVVLASEKPSLPQDVQDYIDERKGCNHLGGEDYSDPSRGRAMANELRACGYGDFNGVPASTASVVTVDMDEKRLRKKYKKQPHILNAIDETKSQLP